MTKAGAKSNARELLEELGGPLTIGSLIKSIRLGEGLALEAFAARLGVSRAHLCDVEKGRRRVSISRAAAWARSLGYSESQFVRLALQDVVNEAGLEWRVDVHPSG